MLEVAAWSDPTINASWGNMAVVDNGISAMLFISLAGFGLPEPAMLDPGIPVALHNATVLRLETAVPDGKPPVLVSQTSAILVQGSSRSSTRYPSSIC